MEKPMRKPGRIAPPGAGAIRRPAFAALMGAASHFWRDRVAPPRLRLRARPGSLEELDFLRRTGAI